MTRLFFLDLAARVHQPAAQVELALDPAQLPLRNLGVLPCRRRDQRPGVEDWRDHRRLACRCFSFDAANVLISAYEFESGRGAMS